MRILKVYYWQNEKRSDYENRYIVLQRSKHKITDIVHDDAKA